MRFATQGLRQDEAAKTWPEYASYYISFDFKGVTYAVDAGNDQVFYYPEIVESDITNVKVVLCTNCFNTDSVVIKPITDTHVALLLSLVLGQPLVAAVVIAAIKLSKNLKKLKKPMVK